MSCKKQPDLLHGPYSLAQRGGLGDLTVKPPETHLAEVRNSRGLAPSVLPVSPLQFQQELRHEAEVGFQHIHHKGASDTLPTEKLKELSLCPLFPPITLFLSQDRHQAN